MDREGIIHTGLICTVIWYNVTIMEPQRQNTTHTNNGNNHQEKIRVGAEDFAHRFEEVMRELASE